MLGAWACTETPEETRDHLYEKALRLVDEYRFDEADSTLVEVMWADTLSWLAPEGFALVQERQWMFWDALSYYMRIIKRNPQSVEGLEGSARTLEWIGYPDLALANERRVAGVDPENGASMIRSARLSAELGQLAPAIRNAMAAVRADQPLSVAHMIVARCFLKNGDLDSVATYYDRALGSPAETFLYYKVAADYYEDLGLYDSAIVMSAKAVERADNDFAERVDHFNRCNRLGYFAHSRKMIADLPPESESSVVPPVMKLVYSIEADRGFEVGHPGARIVQRRSQKLTSYIYDAMSCRYRYDYPTHEADLEYVKQMAARRQYTEGFTALLNYNSIFNNSVFTYDHIRSVRDLNAYQEKAPVPFKHTLAQLRANHLAQMPPTLETAIDSLRLMYKNHPVLLLGMADIASDSLVAEFATAERLYRMILQSSPLHHDAFRGLVEMYVLQRNWSRALSLYRQYPDVVDLYADLPILKALVLLWSGETAEGTDAFTASIKPQSGKIGLYRSAMLAADKVHANDFARRLIDEAVKLQPNNPDAYSLAAQWYVEHEMADSALQLAEKGLSLEANHWDLKAIKARCLWHQGQKEAAWTLFEEVNTESNNSNARMLQYYSWCLATDQIRSTEAENLARHGAFADRHNVHDGIVNLCYVYMMIGRADLAIGDARRGLNSYPDSPGLNYYLGYGLYVEEREGAREPLEKAISLGLQGADLQRAEKALKKL
jgi:tetratricopeptide (TPR) repeat protein